MKKPVITFGTVLLLGILSQQVFCQNAQMPATKNKSTQTTKRRVKPLSPLFARYAFSLQQEISEMAHESMVPIIEDDFESDPFTIHRKAFDKELDRIEEFDLKTDGDEEVFAMIQTAETLLLAHKSDINSKNPDEYGDKWLSCVFDIRKAVSNRAFSSEGNCTLSKH
jgi:hypothetical protein